MTLSAKGRRLVTTDQQQLRRVLRLRHLVIIGLAYMAPLAVFDTFGIVAADTDGRVPLSYLLILVAVLFTGYSYAVMVRRHPVAGSAYSYTRRTMHPALGFMVGWLASLDYLFLPMINALLSAIYMGAAFPEVPAWVWILGTIVVSTGANLLGVRIASSLNYIIVGIQLIVAVAFFVFLVRSIASGADGAGFTLAPFDASTVGFATIAGGASILALSFLGFDAVTTLAEESVAPKRDIPRAIFIIVACAGVFFVTITFAMQLAFPDVTLLEDIVGASPEIAKHIGGAGFQAFFLGGYMFAVLGCGLTQQLSAARLLFAMGRDGVLPRRLFSVVSERTGVPWVNVLIVGAIALVAVFIDLGEAASLINFGAFVAFTFVCLSVIAHFFRFERRRDAAAWLLYVVIPAIGAIINASLFMSLDSLAFLVGGAWGVLGLVWLAAITRGFRTAPPSFHGDDPIDGSATRPHRVVADEDADRAADVIR